MPGVDPIASGAALALLAVLGWLLWPLLEYAAHGGLAHGMRTPVTRLHWEHHREPRRVFTSPLAWVPVAGALWAVCAACLGAGPAAALVAGVLSGFARYEWIHWRIHFRPARTERECRLREHHLAHHERPNAYYGVSTDFWDRVFGTLPPADERAVDFAAVRAHPPLRGPSNLGVLVPPGPREDV